MNPDLEFAPGLPSLTNRQRALIQSALQRRGVAYLHRGKAGWWVSRMYTPRDPLAATESITLRRRPMESRELREAAQAWADLAALSKCVPECITRPSCPHTYHIVKALDRAMELLERAK